MRRNVRILCFGISFVILTWLVTMNLYTRLNHSEQNGGSRLGIDMPGPKMRLKPRQRDLGLSERDKNVVRMNVDKIGQSRRDLVKAGLGAYNMLDLIEIGKVRSPEDQQVRDIGYRKYAFNVLISNRLSMTRQIPDIRHRLCKNKSFPHDLPTASVIICFYNEAYSTLLRTFHTVFARSPEHLIKEIVLVDDFSTEEELKAKLDVYVKDYPKVKVVRTVRREGLIRARSIGAEHATGEVVVFLDSHCEVNKEWLEPLLLRIKENSTNVVMPIIDIINMDTFNYEASPLVRGGFTWGLQFRWDTVPSSLLQSPEKIAQPIMSPTMAGGLFAMNRKYFMELGEYDKGMDTWGAENLELSFRIWMCGGRLEIVPCSRVGHIFRKVRPYGDPTGQNSLMKNSVRLARVWLDDYIKYYYKLRPSAKNYDGGDISERVALRKRLKCHSFEWYLNNIYPQQTFPRDHPNMNGAVQKGIDLYKPNIKRNLLLQMSNTELCVQSSETYYSKRALLHLKPCNKNDRGQTWFETDDEGLLLAKLLCLDVEDSSQGNNNPYPRIMKCNGKKGPQQWRWKGMMLFNPATGKCMSAIQVKDGAFMEMKDCDNTNPNMQITQLEGFDF